MKKSIAIILSLIFVFSLVGCSSDKPADSNTTSNTATAISGAKSVADLKGMKISAQSGTFHADARQQIEGVQGDLYPDFTDLLVALKSGAIDGYIAEEPTAFSVTQTDDTLTYIPLKNNDTGFTATKEDTGIAIGLKTGSELREIINTVLSGISEETKLNLMEQMITLSNGGTVEKLALESKNSGEKQGVLKVGMECAYQPFNWTETKKSSLNAVPISGEGKEGLYANGYDVQIAKYVADELNMELEIYAYEFDSLISAVNAGTIDAIVAGMSPTAEREEQVDFTDTYYESNLVVVIRK